MTELAFGAATTIGAAQLQIDFFPLGRIGSRSLLLTKLGNPSFEGGRSLTDDATQLLRLAAQLLIRYVVKPRVLRVDLVHDRLNLAPLAIVTRPDDRVDESLDHAILYRYSRSVSMNAATDSGTKPRIDLPSRTRSRISVDDTSTRRVSRAIVPAGRPASLSTVAPTTLALSAAGLRRIASLASFRICSGLRQAPKAVIASSPMRKKRSAVGNRWANVSNVSTV